MREWICSVMEPLNREWKFIAKQELVRCKDCKWSKPEKVYWYGKKQRCFLWNEDGIDVFEDGFCSYGTRRTDDD